MCRNITIADKPDKCYTPAALEQDETAMSKAWKSAGEASELLGVDERTLRRWAVAGKIRAHRPSPTGHFRYDVEGYLARQTTGPAEEKPEEPQG
jgi:excisionase family DNA binding protein